MRKGLLVYLIPVLVVLPGCSGWLAGGQQADLVHVVGKNSVRSVHPKAFFRDKAFAESENIHAELVKETRGHAVLLAQIKDREQFHVHDEHDLIVYLDQGEGRLKTRHQAVSVKPGDWTLIPRGVPHQFITTSDRPARAVVIRTPPVQGDRRRLERK